MIKCINRVLQGPVIGNAEIDCQRIGLALGQHCNRGPIIAKDRLAAGQHVAHSAIAAVDDQQIDPALSKFGQRDRQLRAGAGLSDVDMRAQAAIEIGAQIAVTARIIDHPDRRRLPQITHPACTRTRARRGIGARSLGKFVDRRCHIGPILVEELTFYRHLFRKP